MKKRIIAGITSLLILASCGTYMCFAEETAIDGAQAVQDKTDSEFRMLLEKDEDGNEFLVFDKMLDTEADSVEIPTEVNGIPVKAVSTMAFSKNTNLKSLTIPEGITELRGMTFGRCLSLEEVYLPSTLETISVSAFTGCPALKNIFTDADNKFFCSENGVLFSRDMTKLISYPSGRTDKQYTVPDTVTSIEDEAFLNAVSLEDINFPSALERIGIFSFGKCTSLSQITLPENLKEIEENAFRLCTSLTEINIPSSVKSLGMYAFYKCTSVEKVNLSEGLEKIGESAFLECENLCSINIPESVISVGMSAFDKTAVLPEPDDTGAVYFCDWLISCDSNEREFNIRDSIKGIAGGAFYRKENLESVYIPESVKYIGSSAFSGCSSLLYIPLHNETELIEAGAFMDCTSLKVVTIPEKVTVISSLMFENCRRLEKVILHDNIKSIEYAAFSHCPLLEKLIIPEGAEVDEYAYELKRVQSSSTYSKNIFVKADNTLIIEDDTFEETVEGIIEPYRGDIDGNGVKDLTDLSMLSLYLLNENEFDEKQIKEADVDKNNAVNLADLAMLKKIISSNWTVTIEAEAIPQSPGTYTGSYPISH